MEVITMGNRATQRAGFSNLVGANNPQIIYSTTAPVAPKLKTIWINTTDNTQQYWSGTAWISMGGGGGSIWGALNL
jgi:hypothetical protein